jgi:hypothetical protein
VAKDQFVEVALLPTDESVVEVETVVLPHLAEADTLREVTLRVKVNHENTILQRRERGGQVDRQCGLADTALLIADRGNHCPFPWWFQTPIVRLEQFSQQ